MATIELIRSFLSQASAQGSRSTAMNPLGWLVAMLISGLVGCVWAKSATAIIASMATLVVVSVVAYLGAYIYFALTNIDALRSEKYTLSKMAMEKSLIGDDIAGIFETTENQAIVIENPLSATGESQDE